MRAAHVLVHVIADGDIGLILENSADLPWMLYKKLQTTVLLP